MATFHLEEATVADINAAFDAGALTSKQLVQLYLNRIQAYDNNGPNINSIITVNPSAIETAAALDLERQATGPRSPLHGIPVILKDNYDTFDLPTTGGSITLEGSIPPDDAFLVKQFRDAGAVILAKANMSELALSGGRSSLSGQALNPYKLNRYPSGSSSGTGAAIAANFGVFGIGSDTGGSIRGPSAVNCLVGIKPTLGLTSRDGIIPVALSFDVGGPMARTVTDAAIALGSMAEIDLNDLRTFESKGKFFKDYTPFLNQNALVGARIGVVRNFFGGNAEVDQSIEAAITKMSGLGATIVVPLSFSDDFHCCRNRISRTIIDSEFKSQIEAYLATLAEGYPKTLTEIIAISESKEVVNSEHCVSTRRIDAYKRAETSGGLTNPAYIDAVENGIPFVRDKILDLMDSSNLDALIYPGVRCPSTLR